MLCKYSQYLMMDEKQYMYSVLLACKRCKAGICIVDTWIGWSTNIEIAS